MARYIREHVRKSQQERREEILDATLRLISEHGIEGTTVARIAGAVGLTPGALYRHFESRGALIYEANRVASDRALAWVESSSEPDILLRMQELASAQAAWAQENFNTVVRPLFQELASPPGGEPNLRLIFEDFKSYNTLVELAEEGKRQGTIQDDVPAEDVAWAVQMFAFQQDLAVLAGAASFVENGTFLRNLKRLLDSFRAEPSRDEEARGR
jgi:AcrR family transcriptional regulator